MNEESKEEIEVITFGLETADNEIVKVYVDKECADDFEVALGQRLSKEDDIEAVMDIESAINTIHKRSVGLINFVENYRSLTKIPKPNFKIFEIKSLFENIKVLLKEELDKEHITLKSTISPESLQIIGDEQLIEQVLLNLVRNSIHALENKQNKEIKFNAFNNNRFGRATTQI